MEGDPSGKGLRRLPQQVGGGASENEEAAVRPWLVHEDAHLREEVRTPLHLVYHDQASQWLKCQHRVREQGQVLGTLQVKVGHRSATPLDELSGEGRLADLACAEDLDNREVP